VRKLLFRTMACTVVAAGALASGGVMHVHASTGSFTDRSGDVLDPVLTQNRLVAVPSATDRRYADITNVAWSTAGADVAITVSVFNPTGIPAFPQTNGDTGIELNACFDVPSNEAISNGPVQVGTGHHGAPIFDGPYNSRYGWKICGWYSAQAGGLSNIVDYGVATFDPIGQYTFFDKAQLGGNIAAPTTSGNSVTFHLPCNWTTNIPAPAPPEKGIARTETRTFCATGDQLKNGVVSAQVDASVTLPLTLCIPPSDITVPVVNITIPACSIIGPIQGVGGLLTTVDWGPGSQVCSTPVVSCTNDDGGSGLGNGYDLGLIPVGFPGGAVQYCDPLNPLSQSCPTVAGTVNYDLCFPGPGTNTTQDTGDLYAIAPAACSGPRVIPWPYEYHTVNGRILVPNTPQYTPDGWTVTV
jgi:hypothetical protein